MKRSSLEGMLKCPVCGTLEVEGNIIHIQAGKLFFDGLWFSQCLVCLKKGVTNKGYFVTQTGDSNA